MMKNKRDRIAVELFSIDEVRAEHLKYVYFDSWEGADRWASTINKPLDHDNEMLYLPFLFAKVCR